jgi:hypothetical protein
LPGVGLGSDAHLGHFAALEILGIIETNFDFERTHVGGHLGRDLRDLAGAWFAARNGDCGRVAGFDVRNIHGRKLRADDDPCAVFADLQDRLAGGQHLAAFDIAAEDDAGSGRDDGDDLAGAFKREAGIVEICLRCGAGGVEAADAIESLLRGLADDFGFCGVCANGRAAKRGEDLARINARAFVDHQGFDHAGSAERERSFALVGEKSAGAQNTRLLPLLDAVHFNFDGRDRLRLCRFGFRLGR